MISASVIVLMVDAFGTGMNQVVVILAMGGKFAITCTFAMIFLYTSELYATSMRTFGLGMCNCMSRVAGIFSPFAAELVSTRVPHVYTCTTVYALLARFLLNLCMNSAKKAQALYFCFSTGYTLPWIVHARIWHSVHRRWAERHLAARD